MVMLAPRRWSASASWRYLPVGTPPLLLVPLVAALGFTAVGWNGIFLALMAEQGPPG